MALFGRIIPDEEWYTENGRLTIDELALKEMGKQSRFPE